MKPDRVVIGCDDPRAGEIMRSVYAPFTRTGAPIMVMDTPSAELCKYAANAMLATRISFMNEVAQVCEQYGANVDEVRRAVASDKRIGAAFLFPGVGYGGSCFPKDVKAILKFSKDKGYTFRILEAVEQVNAAQKQLLVTKMQRHFGSQITYARKSYEALVGADALALVTEWNEFREPDFARMKKLMKAPVVFDGRNIYNPQQMKAHGFTYFSIGR
jgi:UDPglucose 6-dehydrogenase